ncbi:MAG: hypothetical protein A2V90_03195 [Gammaproteobacteria bacterium RBG_16_57_12]|nr:MAG: hypothetical protein A2V90_03195 [Gammaproteobacteria bacterium RBG_16_57_12]
MEEERLSQQLHEYALWKADVARNLGLYQNFLESQDNEDNELILRIEDIIESLSTDRIVIAFVAEFSRGKTELINAIFFADYKRRLLPSDVGRTTMCPTELLYDHVSKESYIRLLPIETRLEDTSIAEHKRNLDYWTTLPLQVESPDKMVEAFKEVVKVKRVSLEEAKRLGLFIEDMAQHLEQVPEYVEVPMWRHALISFPHPLLKGGLVILDTPGLNALGTEPELTVDMLPNAHAVIFVLGADTGVTKTDMDMWQEHVKVFSSGGKKGLLVALNKIDTMWDELENSETVASKIKGQCVSTAKTLGIDVATVFPISAHKGLLGKVKHEAALLERSGLPKLERVLSDEILPQKQRIVRDRVINGIGATIKMSRDSVKRNYDGTRQQLDELQSLDVKNNSMIAHLLQMTRKETIIYETRVENFQTSRALLMKHVKEMQEFLNITELDKHITAIRKQMEGSWTTGGMKKGMTQFFEQIRYNMTQVSYTASKANESMQSIYKRFHEDFGLVDIKPSILSMHHYDMRMDNLAKRAEEYRDSTAMTVSEQSFVIKKFFISIVSHARDIFAKAFQEVENWSKSSLVPIAVQLKDSKTALQRRIDNLQRIRDSKETVEGRIDELNQSLADFEARLKQLNEVCDAIHKPLSFDQPPAEAEDIKQQTAS